MAVKSSHLLYRRSRIVKITLREVLAPLPKAHPTDNYQEGCDEAY